MNPNDDNDRYPPIGLATYNPIIDFVPGLRGLVEQQIKDDEAWLRLQAITPPSAYRDLVKRIQGEYRDIYEAAMTMPYPCPPLALIVEAHVRRIARGDTP